MIQENITDLKNLWKLINTGICKVYAMPKHMVLDMPNKKSILKSLNVNADFISMNSLSLHPLAIWLEVSNDNHFSTDFIETDKSSIQNKSFTYELPFIIPGDDFTTRGKIIELYDKREFILAIKESSKDWRLVGTNIRGCDFNSAMSSGTQLKYGNKKTCGFYFESGKRAYYLKDPKADLDIYFDSVSIYPSSDEIEPGFIVNGTAVPIDCTLQYWLNNEWVNIDSLLGCTDGYQSPVFTYILPASGTFYFRIKTSTGQYSNTYKLIV